MLKHNTAILIFARSVKEELRYKPFLAQNALLQKLHRHTVNTARRSGLPIIIYDETKQIGSDFGTRFTNAIESIFDSGYENIITIGNDCPHLRLDHITKAEKAILNQKNVIGGSLDGGFYLLGISKSKFDRNTFLNLNWNSDTLYADVLGAITSTNTKCTILPKLRDVDYYSDLEKLILDRISDSKLRYSIYSILFGKTKLFAEQKTTFSLFTKEVVSNKGSPTSFIGL